MTDDNSSLPVKRSLIPIDEPSLSFKSFLKEDNKRIFFSAGYGLGKTYFLQKFFEKNHGVYDTYHLFPVRYHISGNEDIIKLLKYDIFVEACKKYEDTPKNNKSIAKKIYDAIKKIIEDGKLPMALLSSAGDMISIACGGFPAMSLLGRSIEAIKPVYAFSEALSKCFCGVPDEKNIEKYKASDITASDEFSVLVQNMVNELKENKRSVLILDDLDRIDPEHIFRILNIFSVHDMANPKNEFAHDPENPKNELGFDHVIIVGDMDNIREIFHYKYGREVEFHGYFDKFYSTTPYIFDNNKAVHQAMMGLLSKLPFNGRNSNRDIYFDILELLVLRSFEEKIINIRQIYNRIEDYRKPSIKMLGGSVAEMTEHILYLYMSFFPSKQAFCDAFKSETDNFLVKTVDVHNTYEPYNKTIAYMLKALEAMFNSGDGNARIDNRNDVDEYKKIKDKYGISPPKENTRPYSLGTAESVIYNLSYLYCKHILR